MYKLFVKKESPAKQKVNLLHAKFDVGHLMIVTYEYQDNGIYNSLNQTPVGFIQVFYYFHLNFAQM